jgi:hypothetical protein
VAGGPPDTLRHVADQATGFQCASCGARHEQVPLSFHVPAPVAWSPELADTPGSVLDDEVCVVRGEHFFVRGLIPIPITGHTERFEYGVWVSLSEENFGRTLEAWETPGRERLLPPMFGWLAVALPGYSEPTVDLRTKVHTQPVGLRPLVELEPTDHMLSVEQRAGVTWDQVARRVAFLLTHG